MAGVDLLRVLLKASAARNKVAPKLIADTDDLELIATEANPDVPINQLDDHVLTLSRELLAAEIFELWELPASTVTAVRHQNDWNYTGEHAADVALLQASRAMLGYGHYGPDAMTSLELEAIGIDEDDVTAVTSLLQDSRDSLEGLARAVA